jgi:hypothetical protein
MFKINLPAEKEKGISLLYVIFITGILLSIAFGINRILINQVKMLSSVGQSVVAFYAADSGIERILVDWQGEPSEIQGTLSNSASYQIIIKQGQEGDPECPADFSYCIKSVGDYRGTRRAVEINY